MIENSNCFVAFCSVVSRIIIDFIEDNILLPCCNASVAVANAVAELYFPVEVLWGCQRPGVVVIGADLANGGGEIQD